MRDAYLPLADSLLVGGSSCEEHPIHFAAAFRRHGSWMDADAKQRLRADGEVDNGKALGSLGRIWRNFFACVLTPSRTTEKITNVRA
jgi:hypothetical protein